MFFSHNTKMIVKSKLITGILIILFASFISAADINGRFVITNTDSSKLAVLLQINMITVNNALGGATIVFGFDTSSINLTSNPTKNTDYIFHNFCGNNYSPATITKPMKGRIWVNIDLPYSNSNNGTVVSDTSGWTDVATIYFDITNPNGLADFFWLSSSPFWGIYKDDNLTLLEPNSFENLIYTYDLIPPQLLTASLIDSVNLEIEFTESLDSTSALNISNYSIDNGINILDIHRSTSQNKLIIKTTSHAPGQQYSITVNNVSDLSGNLISATHNSAEYTLHPSNSEDEKIPTEFLLNQNYPNPFNPSTVIRYQLPVSSQISLKVYDILGNEVATLVEEFKPAGSYQAEFNTSSSTGELASGVYIYRLQTNEFTETKKMVLLR